MGFLAVVLPVCCFPSEKLEWTIKMVLVTKPKVHSRAI